MRLAAAIPCTAVLLLAAPAARAVVRTELIVLLGIELPARTRTLLPRGFTRLESPTKSWTGDTRPRRLYLGRVLGRWTVFRWAEVVSLPPPNRRQVNAARRALRRAGLPERARLFVLLQYSGGK